MGIWGQRKRCHHGKGGDGGWDPHGRASGQGCRRAEVSSTPCCGSVPMESRWVLLSPDQGAPCRGDLKGLLRVCPPDAQPLTLHRPICTCSQLGAHCFSIAFKCSLD